MKAKLGTFVQVEWDDASGGSGVFSPSRDHRPILMQTRGWVVASNTRGVSVAAERYEEEGYYVFRGWTFIPRGMLVSVKKVGK